MKISLSFVKGKKRQALAIALLACVVPFLGTARDDQEIDPSSGRPEGWNILKIALERRSSTPPSKKGPGAAEWGDALLGRMESAYERVASYQASIEVRDFSKDGSVKVETFLYTFKKPNRIRIDFEYPYPGMVMIYPDQNGNVSVRPFPALPFFKLHLSPNSSLLANRTRQRIDQTDLGLFIENIGRSMTDRRRGPFSFEEKSETIVIRVLSEDHFQKGLVTLYRFFIDKKLWLPAGAEESDPEGNTKRIVAFRDLRIDPPLPDSFFQMEQ